MRMMHDAGPTVKLKAGSMLALALTTHTHTQLHMNAAAQIHIDGERETSREHLGTPHDA